MALAYPLGAVTVLRWNYFKDQMLYFVRLLVTKMLLVLDKVLCQSSAARFVPPTTFYSAQNRLARVSYHAYFT